MYLVVFRNRKRTDIDCAAYDAQAQEMEALAAQQPGFLSFKSYSADDGEVVALSEWQDEASARGFFGPGFAATMREKFGAEPEVFGVDTLLVVDGPEA